MIMEKQKLKLLKKRFNLIKINNNLNKLLNIKIFFIFKNYEFFIKIKLI